MTWVCDIPGASGTTATLHFALQLGLAAFVVVAGIAFLSAAFVAYRRPIDPLPADEASDRRDTVRRLTAARRSG
jgi:hypothetical protein